MRRKLTTEEFIEKAKKVHGNKYDYSKVEYKSNRDKVCIICHEKNKNGNEHGEFWQTPNNHLRGQGCMKCSSLKSTTEEFIKKAKKIHGGKYDYSKVEYINKRTKVCIICPKHGEFWQLPKQHLNGSGCWLCANSMFDTDSFIKKAKAIHGDKYNYSKVEYINAHTNLCIICPIHGEFWQMPQVHLQGQGCPKCVIEINAFKRRFSKKEFINKTKVIHGDKYDYSKVEYINKRTKVCIICHEKDEDGVEHGEFWQTPSAHFSGQGCPKCGKPIKDTTEEFIKKAKSIHGDRYDYSKVEYKDTKFKVCIICPKHGEFWQEPNSHLNGRGCPKCNESQLEREISLFFDENNIICEKQKTFNWLFSKGLMKLDFYLPDYNVAIECQGIQHFESVDYFGGEEALLKTIERDELKYDQCKEHGIEVLYYTNVKVPEDYEKYAYTDKNMLLEKILSK